VKQFLSKRIHSVQPNYGLELTQRDLSFDYAKIDPKYHVSTNEDDEVILYKGAPRNLHTTGLSSLAITKNLVELISYVKASIESGDEQRIYEVLDAHTSYHSPTALLSATYNPELAQMFAPTKATPWKKDSTIYQLRIKAKRCILDWHQTGYCGNSKEILILGQIFPHEITAVKQENNDEHSELRTSCGRYIRERPQRDSTNRKVKDPNNWLLLNQ
jgi:hypothetical protein